MELKYDFLVIGTGLGGLSFALKAAAHGKVCLITKAELEETNTRYAQGGIAAVTYEPDSYNKHVEDTLIAGDGLCDEEIVKMVVLVIHYLKILTALVFFILLHMWNGRLLMTVMHVRL